MVILAEGVSRRYGGTVALDGVSLEVSRGEVFGLVGPNGAGKTTLVRALTGTTVAGGRVELFGAHPQTADPARIGLLPQEFDPPARLTARELVAYYAGLYEETRDVRAVIDDVGLATATDTRYEKLSGGQRRRTCVGTALVNDPEVLFLDEPTTGIDPAGRRTVWRLLEDLAAGGTTVFLTTHDMREAARLADRVGLLADGRLVEVGTPEALVAAHGGESRLVVEGADPDAASSALEEAGYGLASDDSLPAEEVEVKALAVGDAEPTDIEAVVAVLEDAGVEYSAVTWRQPDLEDAFLRLTGESEIEPTGTTGSDS